MAGSSTQSDRIRTNIRAARAQLDTLERELTNFESNTGAYGAGAPFTGATIATPSTTALSNANTALAACSTAIGTAIGAL